MESRRVLTETVLPMLNGDERLAVLMVISALGMAGREMAAEPALSATLHQLYTATGADSAADLVKAIRAGHHDASLRLYDNLLAASDVRMRVAKGQKPKA
jgi:hypothetical protein